MSDYSRQLEIAAQLKAKKQLMYEKFRKHTPSEMLEQKRWVKYFLKAKEDGQGMAKIPLGDHGDEATWSTFHEAYDKLEHAQGLGYCFYKGNIHGLDIDHCRNPKTGIVCNEAMLLVSRLGSWAEYSVSGQGIHVLFKGNVRGKQLGETCLQYWNPKNSPRFFAMTCNMVGEAFTNLKDIGDDFNYIFATSRHISAKIREELKQVDYDQWAALPVEIVRPEDQPKEKAKHKTRKLHKDFNVEDFLKFYSLPVDNVTKNELGTCYRLTTCPIKGEPHVGQNSTSTNFILSNDGGLGFHCQSTGCVDYQVAQVIEHLATGKGPYPNPIYVAEKAQPATVTQVINIEWADTMKRESIKWLIPEFLPLCEATAFSGEMDTRKSTTAIDIAAKGSVGGGESKLWFNNQPFEGEPFSTVFAGTEDSFNSTVINRFVAAGGNLKALGKLPLQVACKKSANDGTFVEWSTPLSFDAHLNALHEAIVNANKSALYPVGLLINDPLIAFFGNKSFNKAQDCQDILAGLKKLCEELNISIIDLMHYNKTQGASAKEKTGGSQRLIEAHRMAWGFTLLDETDKESNTLIAPIKKNLLRVAQSYEITTVSTPVDWEKDGAKKHDDVGVVKFERLSDETADGQLQEKEAKDKAKGNKIRKALLEVLKSGKAAPKGVVTELQDLGSEKTIKREYKKLEESGKVRTEGSTKNTFWMLATSPEQIGFDAPKKGAGSAGQECAA